METDHHMDRNAALADMRYTFIEKVCENTVTKCQESREHIRSVKIDNVLTNKLSEYLFYDNTRRTNTRFNRFLWI